MLDTVSVVTHTHKMFSPISKCYSFHKRILYSNRFLSHYIFRISIHFLKIDKRAIVHFHRTILLPHLFQVLPILSLSLWPWSFGLTVPHPIQHVCAPYDEQHFTYIIFFFFFLLNINNLLMIRVKLSKPHTV